MFWYWYRRIFFYFWSPKKPNHTRLACYRYFNDASAQKWKDIRNPIGLTTHTCLLPRVINIEFLIVIVDSSLKRKRRLTINSVVMPDCSTSATKAFDTNKYTKNICIIACTAEIFLRYLAYFPAVESLMSQKLRTSKKQLLWHNTIWQWQARSSKYTADNVN